MSLLLIDDDHNDLALFSLAPDQTDLNVWLQTALDGQHAMEYLLGDGDYSDRALYPLPQLIVLDLKMPRADGLEFLAWHRTSAFSSIPVVLFADSPHQELLAKARSLGADYHVPKPFDFQGWQAAVRKIWALAQLPASPCAAPPPPTAAQERTA